jgi:putative ABC transport system permease protein
MFDNFRVAFISLGSNKLRTFLTMLGVMIGVAAVIVLVSVGQAFEKFVIEQFSGVGANLIFVIGGQNGRGGFEPLTQRDVLAVDDPSRVSDALRVMPQRNLNNRTVKYESREQRVTVQGVTPIYLAMFNRRVVAGRFIDERDLETQARVVVVEQALVDVLFPDVFPVGQNIRIADVRFTVIGVLGREGSGTFGSDDGVIIPITTAQTRLSGERILSGARPVSFITVQARDADSVQSTVAQIRQSLRQARGINFRDEDNFIVFTQNEILDTLGNITGLLTVFLALLAGISLIVGGIGIMNIMLVTVTERTREIGLRKAVGAQSSDILLQFLTEAVVLSLVGGLVGVAIALVVTLGVSASPLGLVVGVDASSVGLATVISVAVGVLSGIYPANRAAQLNPIDALRYE